MTTGVALERSPSASEVPRLPAAMCRGEAEGTEEMLSHLYGELRALAAGKLAHEYSPPTLQASELVNEAWLRLLRGHPRVFPDRACFLAAVSETMRRILVEDARRKATLKRGGSMRQVDIECAELPAPAPDERLLAVDEALTRLAESEPECAEVVKLCFFMGLTQQEAAGQLRVSVSTVERRWVSARAWLYREIQRIRDQLV